MRTVELVIAIVLACLGVRSLVYWLRRPFASAEARDHALFALYVTGRAGSWFAFAGMFLLFAIVGTTDPVTGERVASQGRAFVDAVERYRWYVLVPVGFAVAQFVAGWFLGRRPGTSEAGAPGPGPS